MFEDDNARPFFANRLSESEIRRGIARKLGLSEQNDFALLEAVGGECAGAVSLLPDGAQPVGQGTYRALNDDEFNALMAELPRRPMLAGEQGIRLSLAEAQNKLPVYFGGNVISLPLGKATSSHILKPPISYYPHTVQDECFCMQMALRVGLPVPRVTILHKQQSLYLIERYDRRRMPDGELQRVHQEDFCQALGFAPDQQYDKEGGPTLQQCFALLRERSVYPVADIRTLLNCLSASCRRTALNVSEKFSGSRIMAMAVLPPTAPGAADRVPCSTGGRRWQRH